MNSRHRAHTSVCEDRTVSLLFSAANTIVHTGLLADELSCVESREQLPPDGLVIIFINTLEYRESVESVFLS